MSDTYYKKTYIIKGEGEEPVPLDCPICKLTLRDLSDAVSYETYKCCVECRDEFIFKNKDDWSSGKRPTKEQIDDFRKNLRSRPSYLLS
tara:strand:+ start:319 stop:585 length:267 start_codon:yes stop_codon:yes gene_type:complete